MVSTSWKGIRMAPLTLLLPMHPDNIEAWRRLCQEMMGTRREQYEASRRQLGVIEERISLVHTARGVVALLSMDVEEPEGFLRRLLASTTPFDLWFKRQLREIQGVALPVPATDMHNEVLLRWQRRRHGSGESEARNASE